MYLKKTLLNKNAAINLYQSTNGWPKLEVNGSNIETVVPVRRKNDYHGFNDYFCTLYRPVVVRPSRFERNVFYIAICVKTFLKRKEILVQAKMFCF